MRQNNRFKKTLRLIILFTTIAILIGAEFLNLLFLKYVRHEAFRPIMLVFQIPAYVIAILIVLTNVFAWLNKKISRLTIAIHKVAQGNFQTKLDVKKGGPLKDVYQDFNIMTQELSKTASLKDDFVNDFSHEFKTPITSIKGFAELLQEDNLSKEEQQKVLKIIINESDRLAHLSNNVILLTKLNSTNILTNRTNFSLSEQLRQAIIVMMPQFEKKHINVHIDILEASYYGDKHLLEQVWINILNNARKFTNENGDIWISLDKKENNYDISFKNNGPLIPEEKISHLQQRFYQLNDTNKEGLGLGLNIVKKIIDLYHGKMIITSSKQELTKFEILLPIN